jgi:hypothetical protein
MLAMVFASCANHHPFARSQVVITMPRTWFLVVAPITREFPSGDMDAPLSRWSKVTTFDTDPACEAELDQAENNLQRPVQCVASDDPRLLAPVAELNAGD